MFVLAVVAPFEDTPQFRSPAGLDGVHQTVLMPGQGVGLPVRGRLAFVEIRRPTPRLAGDSFLRALVGSWFHRPSSLSSGLAVVATTLGETAA